MPKMIPMPTVVELLPTRRCFFADEWYRCHWCDWRGYFNHVYVPDKYVLIDDEGFAPTMLCLRCIELEEPPWRPNNRQRCQTRLSKLFSNLDDESTRLIAEYLAANVK